MREEGLRSDADGDTSIHAQPASLTAFYLLGAESQPDTSCGAEQVIARATTLDSNCDFIPLY